MFRSSPRTARPSCTFGVVVMLSVLAMSLTSACKPTPLPEAGTPPAELYVQRCGGCHIVYRPRMLTAAMWETMVRRMEIEMKRRGQFLSSAEREEILAYLARNAGTR